MTEQQEKKNALARDVIKLSRNTLLVHLRFLDIEINGGRSFQCGNRELFPYIF